MASIQYFVIIVQVAASLEFPAEGLQFGIIGIGFTYKKCRINALFGS